MGYRKQYKQLLKQHPQIHYVRFKPFVLSSSPKWKHKDKVYGMPKGIRVPFFIWYGLYQVMVWQDKRSSK